MQCGRPVPWKEVSLRCSGACSYEYRLASGSEDLLVGGNGEVGHTGDYSHAFVRGEAKAATGRPERAVAGMGSAGDTSASLHAMIDARPVAACRQTVTACYARGSTYLQDPSILPL